MLNETYTELIDAVISLEDHYGHPRTLMMRQVGTPFYYSLIDIVGMEGYFNSHYDEYTIDEYHIYGDYTKLFEVV